MILHSQLLTFYCGTVAWYSNRSHVQFGMAINSKPAIQKSLRGRRQVVNGYLYAGLICIQALRHPPALPAGDFTIDLMVGTNAASATAINGYIVMSCNGSACGLLVRQPWLPATVLTDDCGDRLCLKLTLQCCVPVWYHRKTFATYYPYTT